MMQNADKTTRKTLIKTISETAMQRKVNSVIARDYCITCLL